MSARPAKGRHGGRFNLPDAVAARVRDLRVAKGWSQERMAEEAGLSKDALSRIERGDRNPRLVTLEQIGAAAGCSLPRLVDFEDTLPRTPPPQPRDRRANRVQRLLDQLDPALVEVVITLLRGLVRAEHKRARKGRPG